MTRLVLIPTKGKRVYVYAGRREFTRRPKLIAMYDRTEKGHISAADIEMARTGPEQTEETSSEPDPS